eukprot:1192886-Prorocentrum_minimum.AAC.4
MGAARLFSSAFACRPFVVLKCVQRGGFPPEGPVRVRECTRMRCKGRYPPRVQTPYTPFRPPSYPLQAPSRPAVYPLQTPSRPPPDTLQTPSRPPPDPLQAPCIPPKGLFWARGGALMQVCKHGEICLQKYVYGNMLRVRLVP